MEFGKQRFWSCSAPVMAMCLVAVTLAPSAQGNDAKVVVDRRITVVVDSYTSIARDSSGSPVIAYYDATNGDLKVAVCGSSSCHGKTTINSPDTGGMVGKFASMVLDASDNPVISYYDETNHVLKVLHCDNRYCEGNQSAKIMTPDPGTTPPSANFGLYTSLALDGGNPVISYYDLANGALKVLHCADPDCAGDESGNINTPDSGGVGMYSSLALDGHNPVVSYYDLTNGALKVLHCADSTCASGVIVTADTGAGPSGNVGLYTSLALDGNGFPVVSYHAALDQINGVTSNQNLKVLHCGDATCSTNNTINSPDTAGAVGVHTSLVLSGENPVISYLDDAFNNDLRVLHCDNPACSGDQSAHISVPDSGNKDVGFDTSLILDVNGYPIVSYYDLTSNNLKVLVCDDPNCQ